MWLWLDRAALDYTNWGDYQPDDGSYGAIRASDGKWRTGNRWYDRSYICKTPKGETIILIKTQFEIMFLQHHECVTHSETIV